MPKLNLQNLLFLGAAKPGSGSGGGSVDYSRVVEKSATIPTASEQTLSKVYMYTGDTNETYTHGYIYECKATPVYSDSTTFEPATISGTVVTETNNALSALAGQYIHGDVTSIASGTLTFDSEGNLWIFYGYDSENTEVGHFQLYQEDYEDAGFTFTGTPQNNDVVAFTCTITQTSSIYYWERIDVQPEPAKELPTQAGNSGKFLTTNGVSPSWATVGSLPTQTGNAGKFLTTDGTDASWSDKPLVNIATDADSFGVGGRNTGGRYNTSLNGTIFSQYCEGNVVIAGSAGSGASNTSNSVIIGGNSGNGDQSVIVIGSGAKTGAGGGKLGIAIGRRAGAMATGAIQLGSTSENVATENYSANTFKVANANGNFEMMSADGTIPADRLASTSGLADGNYRLRLTMASGVPTLSWVAE